MNLMAVVACRLLGFCGFTIILYRIVEYIYILFIYIYLRYIYLWRTRYEIHGRLGVIRFLLPPHFLFLAPRLAPSVGNYRYC